MIKPIIDDTNPGVREVAWIMMRPHLMTDLTAGLTILTPWVLDKKTNIRRLQLKSPAHAEFGALICRNFAKTPNKGFLFLPPLNLIHRAMYKTL